MEGTKSDVRVLFVLLLCSLGGNVFLAARLLRASVSARAQAIPTPIEFKEWFAKQMRQEVPIAADGAKVVIVEFSDFQCPACRRVRDEYQPVIRRVQADYPRLVKFLVKDFPLESECNLGVKKDIHPAACESAAAVRLAEKTGKGEELASWLFARQASLTPESVWEAARSVTGNDRIKDGYADALNDVREDVSLGERLGVRATPTVFVNGVGIGAPPAPLFEAVVLDELRRIDALRSR